MLTLRELRRHFFTQLIGNADVPGDLFQRRPVDPTEDKVCEGPPQIIEIGIAVYGGDDGNVCSPGKQRAVHICPRAVAVNDINAVFPDKSFEPPKV